MDYEKLVVGLASAVAGWVLAQFAAIFKNWYQTRKVKICLLEELKELRIELERTLLIYSRKLQIYGLDGFESSIPIFLSNHIFKAYYKDAVLGLNSYQRISIQTIHALVDSLNSGIDDLKELNSDLHEKIYDKGVSSITESDKKRWGDMLTSHFVNVAQTIWHVRFHLQEYENPKLEPYSEFHIQYLKYTEKVEAEIKNIVEKAKSLDKASFEKIYDPEVFVQKFL